MRIKEITRTELYNLIWKFGQRETANRLELDLKRLPACLDMHHIPRPDATFFLKRGYGHDIKQPPLPKLCPHGEIVCFVDGVEESIDAKRKAATARVVSAADRADLKIRAAEAREKAKRYRQIPEPSEEELTRWRHADQQKKASQEVDEYILDLISSGMSMNDISQHLGLSYSRIGQRLTRALRRLAKLSNLPISIVSSVVKTREKGKRATEGRGPFSPQAATVTAVARLLQWEVEKREVASAQSAARPHDPFFDVRAWLNANRNRAKFKCPYSLHLHLLAWNLHVIDRHIWAGELSDLPNVLQAPKHHFASRHVFLQKVMEPASRDLSEFGDFHCSWELKHAGGRNHISLEFRRKSSTER